MRIPLAVIAAGVCATGTARAQEVVPLITRPLTLPRGSVDFTPQLTYSNWSIFGTSIDGESLAAGLDYGATDKTEIGLAVAFPINPGASFGSVLGSIAVATSNTAALRLDAGYERVGVNGGNAFSTPPHFDRFFGGIGARIRIPISPTLAFVSGRVGAVHFGHFVNVGNNGVGFYNGASAGSEGAADFFVISAGNNNSGTNFGINLPAGLLLQPDPHLALTLQSGYSTIIQSATNSTNSVHFIPIAVEAVVSPAALLDIGLRFFIDGTVAQTGGGSAPGYFDMRELVFWLRFHG
jgi:hypothetical protein